MDLTKSTTAQKHKIPCPSAKVGGWGGGGGGGVAGNFAIAIAIGVVLYNEQGSIGDCPIKIT